MTDKLLRKMTKVNDEMPNVSKQRAEHLPVSFCNLLTIFKVRYRRKALKGSN